MLNKLAAFIRQYDLIEPKDEIVCAVSGGADSTALLFGLYLLREKFDFTLSAAHFNHRLRAEESDGDEQFVRRLCDRFDIPLYVGSANVVAGKKGLEAAAREARYAFFHTLSGKIATAHTANDNGETVLLHLVRGTGLKGLGGIAPVNGKIIRPMLSVTRAEVLAFLEEYCLDFVQDSSNETDAFLRNRIRHHVMPLLEKENPKIAENLSEMALTLRQDEAFLQRRAAEQATTDVEKLRQMDVAVRNRVIENFLKEQGVREPEYRHIAAVNDLIFSQKPSAQANLPGNVTVERCYEKLRVQTKDALETVHLNLSGETVISQLGLRVVCRPASDIVNTENVFTVATGGPVVLRSRMAGDEIRLPGGSKLIKKLFIDRKVPASERGLVPVLADDRGVLAVYNIGVNQNRIPSELPALQFTFTKI